VTQRSQQLKSNDDNVQICYFGITARFTLFLPHSLCYFRVTLCLCTVTSLRAKTNETVFQLQVNFHANQIIFCTKTPFETEAQGNSEMTYFVDEFLNKANKRSSAFYALLSTSFYQSTLRFPLYQKRLAMASNQAPKLWSFIQK